MERLTVGFAPLSDTEGDQFNLGDLPENAFRGIASVFGGIVDAYIPTIIDKGAFTKTLQEQTRGVKILWQHNPDEPIGVPTDMFESDRGLVLQAQISTTTRGQDAITLLRDGVIDGLSIGFDAIKQEFIELEDGSTIRHIKEIRLWEVSVVTWGADPNARITEVNSMPGAAAFEKQEVNIGKLELQTVQRFLDLPLSDIGRQWNSQAAKDRLRNWAKADEAPNQKWSHGFICWCEKGESFADYKLPVADIVNGELTIVPEAIFAAAAAVEGARGGVAIPEDKLKDVRRHLATYYRKMRDEFNDPSIIPPWEQGQFTVMTEDDKVEYLRSMTHYLPRDAGHLVGKALTEGLSVRTAQAALAAANERLGWNQEEAESHEALTSDSADDLELMERQLMEAELAMTETFSAVDPL